MEIMKNLKQLSFVLASLFILAALGIKMSKPEWQLYANIAIGAGVFFFLLSLYFERSELMSFFSARSTRYGLNSLVMVIFVLAIVALGNWVVSRHPWKYDTTKNKQFTLSSLTINTLKSLKEPVKITAFFTEAQDGEARTTMKDLLDNYKLHSDKLDIRLVDPLKDPRLTEGYGIQNNRTTVFEVGKQKNTIATTNEEDVTNAILKVTSKGQTTVYFMQGHGEPSIGDYENGGYAGVSDDLKKANYVVNELKDLAATAKIPTDCDVLIVPGPKVAFSDAELKALREYLAGGGRMLALDDPQSDPSLQKLLSDYHVTGNADVVVDDHYFLPMSSPAIPLIRGAEGTPLTKEFSYPMFFPLTRSLSYDDKDAQGLTFTPVAQSTPDSWGETDKEKAEFEEGKDKKGPLTVGLTVTKPVSDADKRTSEMRLVVFGDMNFVENAFTGVPGNKQMFSNAIAWLSEQENLIHLPPRNTSSDVMLLSSSQFNYIALLSVIILPAAVLAVGITVWVKRKKL
jgi:ABC-type uncharacterized transport system involved in gliding motility auxiliary subunit